MLPTTWHGQTTIIGPSDPTRDDLRPCQYALLPSREYPGRPRVIARIEFDNTDRQLIANGAILWLELDGGELLGLTLTHPDSEVPE